MNIAQVWSQGDFNNVEGLGWHVAEGIRKNGYVVEQHHPKLILRGPVYSHDIIVSNGARPPFREMRHRYESRDIPVIVYDLGYLDRADSGYHKGYYQLGMRDLGWIPDFDCPPDRFDNLDLEIKPTEERDGYILVCGQKFGDAQHGMSESQMMMKCKDWLDLVRANNPGREVKFRPHPKDKFGVKGYETVTDKWGDIKGDIAHVVAYNSTIGVQAALEGIHVHCVEPYAHWNGLAGARGEESLESPLDGYRAPSMEQKLSYFHRLAYAQWTRYEFAAGYPFHFIFAVANGKDPFDGTDYTEVQEKSCHTRHKTYLSVEGLSWPQARKKVKEVTGAWSRNKEEMQMWIDKFNSMRC